MRNKSTINQKIQDAFDSIESIEPVKLSPFFYARVASKISGSKLSIWEKFTAYLLKPSIAFATICLVIIINAFVLVYSSKNNDANSNQTEITQAEEYGNITSLYDLENIKP